MQPTLIHDSTREQTLPQRQSDQQRQPENVLASPTPLLVRDLMTAPPPWIMADATLGQAAFAMTQDGVNELLVLDNAEMFVGLLTANDLLFAILPDVEAILAEGGSIAAAFALFLTKGQLMADLPLLPLVQREPQTLAPDEHIAKAATFFAHKRVSSLPVLQEDNVIGLLTATALCQAVLRSKRR